MSTNRNAVLARPQWIISNQLNLPLITIADNGKRSVRGLVGVTIPFAIFLDTLFNDKVLVSGGRSVTQDQFQVYKSMEGALQVAGINGKACLLRAICDMQTRELGHYSLAGELALFLLRPRSDGAVYDAFLDEYRRAEKLGQSQNATCSASYRECPISLFELFQQYSTPEDKPEDWEYRKNQGNDNETTGDESISQEQQYPERRYANTKEHDVMDDMNHIS